MKVDNDNTFSLGTDLSAVVKELLALEVTVGLGAVGRLAVCPAAVSENFGFFLRSSSALIISENPFGS